MDPNANLREQLELAHDILEGEAIDQDSDSNRQVRLAELVIALDEWMRMGGFAPSRWDHHQDLSER